MKNRRSVREGGLFHSFLPCLFLCALAVPIFALVATTVAGATDDPTGNAGVYSFISLLVAAAVSGFAVSRLGGEAGVRMAVLAALAVAMSMMLISIIMTGNVPSLGAVLNCGCYFGVAALAALVGKKRGGRRRR